jgi:hypothetical protein
MSDVLERISKVLLIAMLLAVTPALGQGNGHENDSAPEFGVAAVGTVAVLLAGGGVLVARRRRSR